MSIVNFFNNSKKNLSDNCKSHRAEDPKKLQEEVQEAAQPILETSQLKGSTIQAVVIFYVTASRS